MEDLCLPLPQSEAFERTCRLINVPVRRFDMDVGTCLVQSRKLPLIGNVHLASRGPVFRPGTSDSMLIEALHRQISGPLVINATIGTHETSGLKIAKGAKLAILDLTDETAMRGRLHQKWRNQLKKAERSPLRIVDQSLDARKHGWFLRAEQAQQKAKGYRSYPATFLQAYAAANKGQARLYTALIGTEPVASMLVLKHGRMATYQAGVTTPDGRVHCAHNLLLWRIMTDLQRKGFQSLDLGRADLSEGLTRFKRGAGARIEILPGTFLHHKWLPLGRSRSLQSKIEIPKAA